MRIANRFVAFFKATLAVLSVASEERLFSVDLRVYLAVTSVSFRSPSEACFAPPTAVVLPTPCLVAGACLVTPGLLMLEADFDFWGEHRPPAAEVRPLPVGGLQDEVPLVSFFLSILFI